MIRRALAVGLFFAVLALVLACVSTGINYWYYETDGPSELYFGLWSFCVKLPSFDVSTCHSWKFSDDDFPDSKDLPGWFHVCQAMMVLSIAMYACGIALILLHLTILVHKAQLIRLAGLLFFVGGLCNLVAFAVFAAKFEKFVSNSGGKLHAGFGLAVSSTVFGIVSGLFCLFIKSNSYESM